jgi:peptidoglycan/xylan/chitin deacetylase (PgdA/CDA1 family)
VAIVALLYHDVVGDGPDDSGFPSASAASYKLPAASFARHLDAVAAAAAATVFDPATVARGDTTSVVRTMFTFDDGGSSALTRAAPMLEARGWRGAFFITTDFVGTRGFLDRAQLVELNARGHTIGSHSCTHPLRFADCSWEQMVREWHDSTARLSDMLSAPVTAASVPGGQFSPRVAAAAREAGLQVLFNSEPTTRIRRIEDCTVIGRFSIKRSTPAAVAGRLAAGHLAPRIASAISWNAKKLAKRIGGRGYLRVREALFRKTAPG